MNFEQDVDDAVVFDRLLVDRFDEPLAVRRLNQRNERSDEFYLVGLQVAYHVPLDIFGQGLVLGSQFLRTALAENALSCGISLFDPGRGVRFGYCYQRDAFGHRFPYIR